MALSRVNGKVLAQAHLKAKTRRRRLVVLSSRHLQSSSHRMRPAKLSLSSHAKNLPPPPTMSSDKHALPESRPESLITLDEPHPKKEATTKPTDTAKPKIKPTVDQSSTVCDDNEHHHQSPERQPSCLDSAVQRLQVPYVPVAASDEGVSGELTPCKSSAKRKLDEILKAPIQFVPATQATMATEPARKRRRIRTKEQSERHDTISRLSTEYCRKDLGATGLVNHSGVHCYRRSCLQVLMNLPIFVNWIKLHGSSQKYRCLKPGCLACALRGLANAYWPAGAERRSAQRVDRAVRDFDNAINKLPRCPGGSRGERLRQQDAHEFMVFILTNLSSSEAHKACMPLNEVEALFGLKQFPRRTCRSCGHQETQDPIIWLNASINIRHPRKGLDFKSYFDQFFYETLPSIECEQCRKKVHDRKQVVIDGPEILMVQLARFASDGWGHQSKVKDPVQFPLYLDLSEYFDDKRMQRPGTLRYKLTAVLQHAGGVNSGHYTAKVVSPKGIQDISDDVVEKPGVIKELLRTHDGGFTPYILTYVRVHE
ncbi:ubiquitin carboxyl-terminal hydrolase [Diplodia corticola]|uniref:ubiquitinyl hydrolase 1 n=1 Tax=Diplodia corticola TaxID=236234 RepID=A0A1J9QTV0_9PEZI|nr:ubiquitin carboxyl-terminal hydrolase [Diplodia corticola]OJD31825.1 ubiquitin carboxyl-terminal hydrolase [Diplodia corticola]